MIQFGLPLDWPADESTDAFIVAPSNEAVVRHLDRWGTWPVMATILTGPRKSGRSLLGRIFARKTGGMLVDNAERRREETIFHAWNAAQQAHSPLIIIADQGPPGWTVELPDLVSRLSATPVVQIGEPDEALAAQLLERLLGRRGLAVGREVVAYILARIERSHVAIIAFVDALDAAALSRRRAITVPLVREVLRDLRMIDDGDETV